MLMAVSTWASQFNFIMYQFPHLLTEVHKTMSSDWVVGRANGRLCGAGHCKTSRMYHFSIFCLLFLHRNMNNLKGEYSESTL